MSMEKENKENKENKEVAIPKNVYKDKVCGYVMPISDVDDYKVGHWQDVTSLLNEVTSSIGFKETRVVSFGQDVSTIHYRIVSNLYNDDIIICDVSSRNPNVMFELGMRIAFDKPVIIIKDNSTPYCFDSQTIEHIPYPKDMRYCEIQKFKETLKNKIEKTLQCSINSPQESPILKRFGAFEPKKTDIPVMSENEEIRSEMSELRVMMLRMMRYLDVSKKNTLDNINSKNIEIIPRGVFKCVDERIKRIIRNHPGIELINIDHENDSVILSYDRDIDLRRFINDCDI